jgi:predicted RNase H-like HicB family nuclease
MAKYIYPAVFTQEENGSYSVIFKDLEGCYTCGDTLQEAMEMAADVLALTLYGYETDKRPIPKPTNIDDVARDKGEFVNYVLADTFEYRKMYNNKAVKKTLTIPEWLNTEAMEEGINFSAVLQEALQEKLLVK